MADHSRYQMKLSRDSYGFTSRGPGLGRSAQSKPKDPSFVGLGNYH